MNPAPKPAPTADQSAAHEFLTELRTRIATQPLPYQDGEEGRALESMWQVFGQARAAIKKYPGCEQFADLVTEMLNVELRPLTAKWDRAHEEGRLSSRDGGDEFRADLRDVQEKLQHFVARLHEMAYGTKRTDKLTRSALSRAEIDAALADIPFGIVATTLISDEKRKAINNIEAQAVKQRREFHNIDTPEGNSAVGLALSGGGIRSATFCLGVVQVLADRGLVKDVDLLSTVSGGGYTGCFLTTRLGNKELEATVAGALGPDPAAIRYLRQHAKYLAAVDLKQGWYMAIQTIAGMLLNWTAPLLMTAIAALLAVLYRDTIAAWLVFILAIAGTLTVLGLPVYAWLLRKGRTTAQHGVGVVALPAAACVVLAGLWALDLGYEGFFDFIRRLDLGYPSAIVAALIAAGPAILRFVPILEKPAVRKLVLQVLLYAGALVVPFGAIVLFYLLWRLGTESFLSLVGLVLFFGLVVLLLNVNLTGPHRLYRDRLARTFIHTRETDERPISLAGINPGGSAPYHLINATLNLPSSECEALRDRKSDFFLFSKHWCGLPATDYHPTTEWRTNNSPADLATAMAASGAAASSHMGLGSLPTLSALLTFLNIRLGFWILRPGRARWPKLPGFLCLIKEMTGAWMSEKQKWLNLSDGGHIENMAIYELLRRRCKYIICVDGESDPKYTFEGLMTLVRHAQIDLGVRIDPSLDDIRPDSATGLSQAHSAFCRIYYPGDAIGLLLYLKLSMTGNESELIRRYRIMHPDFPHQTTLDQFFYEEQFEAYRQLGAHVANGMFSRALMDREVDPASIPQWFSKLAKNLLHPARS
jgi:hypothetical protein